MKEHIIYLCKILKTCRDNQSFFNLMKYEFIFKILTYPTIF